VKKTKLVYAIHSSTVSLGFLGELFEKLVPEAQIYNITDDSLLGGLYEYGVPTPDMLSRFCSYAVMAEKAGADALFSQCSSYGEGVRLAKNLINIPFVQIDRPMMEEAARIGNKIALVYTTDFPITSECNLLMECAANINKKIEFVPMLAKGALKVLMEEQNVEKHDKMVMDLIDNPPSGVDCIALLPGSLYRLKDKLKDKKVPVLLSPESGVLALRKALKLD